MDKDIEVGIKQLKDESKAAKTIQEKFNIAVQYVNVIKNINNILDSGKLLEFYGLYKQATVGNCNTPRPSFMDPFKRTMWDKWNSHKDKKTTKDQAASEYVKLSIITIEDLKKDDKKFKKIVEELNKIELKEEGKKAKP